MADLVLGVDCSTTACKVVAWDRAGKAVAEGRADLEEIHPQPLFSEQKAEGWWEGTSSAIAQLMGSIDADRVAGIFKVSPVRRLRPTRAVRW